MESLEEVIKLSNQFGAIPIYAGMRTECVSTGENHIPICGEGYVAEFTGFKAF